MRGDPPGERQSGPQCVVVGVLGAEPRTPLNIAVRETLASMGCVTIDGSVSRAGRNLAQGLGDPFEKQPMSADREEEQDGRHVENRPEERRLPPGGRIDQLRHAEAELDVENPAGELKCREAGNQRKGEQATERELVKYD